MVGEGVAEAACRQMGGRGDRVRCRCAMWAAVGAVARGPAESAGLRPHDLYIAVEVQRRRDAVLGAHLPTQIEKLREVLLLTYDRGVRAGRAELLCREDSQIWCMEANEGIQLVVAAAQLGVVLAWPVLHGGANVAVLEMRHCNGAVLCASREGSLA